MPAPEGHCWLCREYGKLSKEHLPAEKAYNDCPRLLMKINDINSQDGTLKWVPSRYSKGIWIRSLCEGCNTKYGHRYVGPYVDLVKRVAEKISDVQECHTIPIHRVRNPFLILKQVMLQFVTANGDRFVKANDWVAPFIMERWNTDVPRNIAIYLFASNSLSGRNSGVSVHRDWNINKTRFVSEFTSWPLGTIISYDGELIDDRLSPIHHWTQYTNKNQYADLHLRVNPVASEYPLDFRTGSEIRSSAENAPPDPISASEEDVEEMMENVKKISGETENWILTGHPGTVNKLRK